MQGRQFQNNEQTNRCSKKIVVVLWCKGAYLNNGLGKEFLVGALIQGVKKLRKVPIQKSGGDNKQEQHLFIHSTNICSALSVSQGLFKAKKIYQWTNTHAKLLMWKGFDIFLEPEEKSLRSWIILSRRGECGTSWGGSGRAILCLGFVMQVRSLDFMPSAMAWFAVCVKELLLLVCGERFGG